MALSTTLNVILTTKLRIYPKNMIVVDRSTVESWTNPSMSVGNINGDTVSAVVLY